MPRARMTELYLSGFIHGPSPRRGVGRRWRSAVPGCRWQKLLLGLQGFPGTDFVEKQIEETRMVFCKGALLNRLACNGRKAVEESVCDSTCVKQVLYGTQRGCGCTERTCRGRVSEAKSVQSAGIRDLLPSGRIRMRYSRPLRCIVRRNSSGFPSNG